MDAPAATSPTATTHGPFAPSTLIVEAELTIDWKALKQFYRDHGIKCLNCPAAEIESFEEGARIHHFDLEEHLEGLNRLAREHPAKGPPPGFWAKFGAWLKKKLRDQSPGI